MNVDVELERISERMPDVPDYSFGEDGRPLRVPSAYVIDVWNTYFAINMESARIMYLRNILARDPEGAKVVLQWLAQNEGR